MNDTQATLERLARAQKPCPTCHARHDFCSGACHGTGYVLRWPELTAIYRFGTGRILKQEPVLLSGIRAIFTQVGAWSYHFENSGYRNAHAIDLWALNGIDRYLFGDTELEVFVKALEALDKELYPL